LLLLLVLLLLQLLFLEAVLRGILVALLSLLLERTCGIQSRLFLAILGFFVFFGPFLVGRHRAWVLGLLLERLLRLPKVLKILLRNRLLLTKLLLSHGYLKILERLFLWLLSGQFNLFLTF